MLASIPDRLVDRYDVAMLDLDGVVYIGGEAVPGAAAHLAAAVDAGMRTAYITNNASRPPAVVAGHLADLGVAAAAGDVVTSAQAASRVLVEQHGTAASVVLLGGDGLAAALTEAGLTPVGVSDEAAAIATGYGPDVRWRDIMHVAVRIHDGLPWVASNTDYTIPTSYGVAPGHGVLVETLERFSGVSPLVAGKPQRPLLDETVRRTEAARPLMVGDRLDTDIEGAHNAGIDSLLVLTGVTGLRELVSAPARHRPSYLAPDLEGLVSPHPAPRETGGEWQVGGWSGSVAAGRLAVTGAGTAADWWRVAAVTAWDHRDRTGDVADITGLVVPATGRADR